MVEGPQAVVPGRHQVWEHTVQDTDEPAGVTTQNLRSRWKYLDDLSIASDFL